MAQYRDREPRRHLLLTCIAIVLVAACAVATDQSDDVEARELSEAIERLDRDIAMAQPRALNGGALNVLRQARARLVEHQRKQRNRDGADNAPLTISLMETEASAASPSAASASLPTQTPSPLTDADAPASSDAVNAAAEAEAAADAAADAADAAIIAEAMGEDTKAEAEATPHSGDQSHHMRLKASAQQQQRQQSAARMAAWMAAEASAEMRAYAAAEAEAAKFNGIRTAQEPRSSANPASTEKIVYVSKYLLGLMALGTFVVISALGWGFCRCIDSCRSKNY
jgi:pyruvate/2-oxoglutarate dehydrogenase complex dihydrolipoamide acyltransferase (E2) component